MQKSPQQETNECLQKILHHILKTKPELFKKIVKRNQDKHILNLIIQQNEELENCALLNKELQQEFVVLEKLISMANDN